MEERVRELRIPRGALVLLVGAAGCGKSTWARRHFRETEVVSSDECRRLVSDDEGDQTVNGLAFPVFHAIIRGRLALGRVAVADSTNLHPHARERLREIAARRRRPAVAVLFDIPLQLCLERARGRARVVPPEVIRRHHELLRQVMADVESEGYARIYVVRARG